MLRISLFIVMLSLHLPFLAASEAYKGLNHTAGSEIMSLRGVAYGFADPPISGDPRPKELYSRRDQFYGVRHLFVGVHIGSMNVLTDLSGKPGDGTLDFPGLIMNDIGMQGGIFFRYKLNEWFALGVDISYAGIKAQRRTEIGPESVDAFHTSLAELSLRAAWFWPGLEWSPWDVYAYSGLAVYHQQTNFLDASGVKIDPQVLKPEIRSPGLAFPLGTGFSYVIADRLKLGYEFSFRFTGNHSLDGVYLTDSGSDSYMFQSINISFPIANRSGF